ncbi:MAG: family 20 glycosylhydrolase [Planctomycetes bacterium]|nr:family 20 glycosylhydrolase [Planctomycetota bacterium]
MSAIVPHVRHYQPQPGVLVLPKNAGFSLRASGGFKKVDCNRLLRQVPGTLPQIFSGRSARAIPLIMRESAIPQAPKRTADQAYEIYITKKSIEITAQNLPGLRYGLVTLNRILRSGATNIRAAKITDWPDFPVRGILLDISRDKVPTMATLRRLVALFASWKLNQLQLYMEHTFAYTGHETVWKNASPMTPAQIRALDALCQLHGIALVPSQNSLGHMERWLQHPKYAPLAEYDGPYKTPWGETRTKPTTLNPIDPRSIKLVSSLYDQLLPHFSSKQLNVGCDEPFELGQGKSRHASKKQGAGRVYFDYLMKIHREVTRRGHRMQFWSDWIQRDPELIDKLPRDVIPLVWGYEADHQFDEECRRPAKLGLEFYVCPGTSSWCSFAGRTSNMIENMRCAARAGTRHGATGYLTTDWGDFGHRQHLPVSYAGFLFGAAVSWCGKSNRDIDIAAALSRDVFKDATSRLAQAWLAAGRVHEASGILQKNRSVLFASMQGELGNDATRFGVTRRAISRMMKEIGAIRRLARAAKPKCDDAPLVLDELLATIDVLEHACRRLAYLSIRRSSKQAKRSLIELADGMQQIIAMHARLWPQRNRPGGMRDSMSHYHRNLPSISLPSHKPTHHDQQQRSCSASAAGTLIAHSNQSKKRDY